MRSVKPKPERINDRIAFLIRGRVFSSREEIARSIFTRWFEAHHNEFLPWVHGVGAKSNNRPPDPNQLNCQAGWNAYVKGGRRQNLDGWRMVAEVLNTSLDEIVEGEVSRSDTEGRISFKSPYNEAPLNRLGNIEVSSPQPLRGANAVYLEHSRTQAIDLSIKPIFGTLRNEELLSPSGDILAICDVELSYAYVVIEATDVNMGIIDGLGVNGDEVLVGSIYCRYLGAENGRILFEVSPGRSRRSLAGTAQTLKNFVAMEGVFHESDWIGIGIDSGSMLIVSLKSSDLERSETGNSAILRSQIKREILRRGINSQIQNSGARDSTVAARCFFMKRVPDADHN